MAEKIVTVVINKVDGGPPQTTINPIEIEVDQSVNDTLNFQTFIAPGLEDLSRQIVFPDGPAPLDVTDTLLTPVGEPPPPPPEESAQFARLVADLDDGATGEDFDYRIEVATALAVNGKIKIIRQH